MFNAFKKLCQLSAFFACLPLFAGVNPQTGNFFFSVQDYQKKCHQMTLSVQRSYNSLYRSSGNFGQSWVSNLERKIIPLSKISLELVEADGYISTFYLQSLISDKEKSISAIIKRKKDLDIKFNGNPKGKGDKHYLDLKKKMQADQSYFLKSLERYQPTSIKFQNSIFISKDRKSSTLTQTKTGFKRTFINGDTEHYNSNGEIVLEKNRHGTFIRYIYRNGLLKTIRDSCGQYLSIDYDKKNRIQSIRSSKSDVLNYIYDDKTIKNTLSRFKGMGGDSLIFNYDNFYRLTKITFPKDTIQINYDKNSGKVTRVSGPDKSEISYSYTKSLGQTVTKIKNHNKETHQYTYIPAKNQSTYTAPDGTEQIKTLMACCAKLKSIKNSSGKGKTYIYDDNKKNLIELRSSGEPSIFYSYNAVDLVNEIRHGSKRIDINYNTQYLPIELKKNKTTLLEASYDIHGNLKRIYNNESDLQINYTNNGDPSQIRLKNKRKTYVLDLVYASNGTIKNRFFLPNKVTTQDIIENKFKALLDQLQLKQYLPKD